MQFFIFLSVFFLTTLISVLFSKLLNDGYRQKTYDQKVDSVVSQCSWLGDQVVGVDFHLDDGSHSLCNQIDELAASMNGRIIVIKNNYKIIKDTHTDFQSRFFLNDNVLDVMDGKKTRIVSESGKYIEVMVPIVSKAGKQNHILGAVQATVPSEDMMGAVTEMEHRRNMLLVACIICGLSMAMIISYLLTRDLKKIQRDVDFIAAGHEDESIEETGFLEVRSIVQRFNEILGRMQTLEESRQEFVSNVSHELKTPIALIQGYSEGLLENVNTDEESRKFYAEVILDETNKMDKLVKQLLELMKLEYGKREFNDKEFNIIEVEKEVIRKSKVMLEENKIEVKIDTLEPIQVFADDFYIEQVITNYITNAIKNAKEINNCKLIKISNKINKEEGKVRVTVFNSGNHIKDEDLERIWNRFYKESFR